MPSHALKRVENQRLPSERRAQEEDLGALVSGIARDLNDVLTVMVGYTELALKQMPKMHRARADLGKVLEAGDRAAALVRPLLTFGLDVPCERRGADMNEAVQAVLGWLQRSFPQMLSLELAEELPWVRTATHELESVVLNLVEAIEGEGSILVSTRNLTLHGHRCLSCDKRLYGEFVELSVRGFDPTQTGDIETKRYRPPFKSEEHPRGTGLRLYAVYEIVSGHGGHVDCQGEARSGMTFRVCLPVDSW